MVSQCLSDGTMTTWPRPFPIVGGDFFRKWACLGSGYAGREASTLALTRTDRATSLLPSVLIWKNPDELHGGDQRAYRQYDRSNHVRAGREYLTPFHEIKSI